MIVQTNVFMLYIVGLTYIYYISTIFIIIWNINRCSQLNWNTSLCERFMGQALRSLCDVDILLT